MPELPEVETVKRTLQALVVGKQIKEVTVFLSRIIQRPNEVERFCHHLTNRTIIAVERRGKFLRILLDGFVLLSHLRMEGRYGVYRNDMPVQKHTHVVFHFMDGTQLRYQDVRQFGTMHLFVAGEEWTCPPLSKLGIEPLSADFTVERLKERLQKRRSVIKSALLNQQVVAGIGNIYVDEVLFQAGIHPQRIAHKLTDQEYVRLHQAIIETLQAAVHAGGSSIKSYVNGQGEAGRFQHQLQMYGRHGYPCYICHTQIEKKIIGGRGTHWCPFCQPCSS